jgi:hypothetical protein
MATDYTFDSQLIQQLVGDSRFGTVRETRSLAPLARGAYCQSAAFFCFFSLRQHKEKKRWAEQHEYYNVATTRPTPDSHNSPGLTGSNRV